MWINPGVNVTLEHPDWGYSVLRNENGNITDPMELAKSFYVFFFNFVNCLSSLPINVYLAFVILYYDHLRNDPNYIIQLNVILSNLLSLVIDTGETIYYLQPDEGLCHFFIATNGLSYETFLFNTLLLVIDRFVCITHLRWHRKKVTRRFVAIWSLVLNVMFVMILDCVYILGLIPLRCAHQKSHVITLVVTWSILVITCTILIALIFAKTRLVDHSPTVLQTAHSSSIKKKPSSMKPLHDPMNNSPAYFSHQHSDCIIRSTTASEQQIQTADSTLEMVEEALALIDEKKRARKFVSSLNLVLILPVVLVMTSIPSLVCIQFYHPDEEQCRPFVLLAFIDDKIVSLNALISPLIVICKDPQIRTPLLHWLKRYHRSFPRRFNNFLSAIV